MAKDLTARDIVTTLEDIATAKALGDADEIVALATEIRAWGVDRHSLGREAIQLSNATENYAKTNHRNDWQRIQAAATRLVPHFRELGNTHR